MTVAAGPLLQTLRESLADCTAVATLDVASGRVSESFAEPGAEENLHAVVLVAPELFATPRGDAPAPNDEVVIVSPDRVWLLHQRGGTIVIVTCGGKANLGALIARVRVAADQLEAAA
jgi:hypothetical protein